MDTYLAPVQGFFSKFLMGGLKIFGVDYEK